MINIKIIVVISAFLLIYVNLFSQVLPLDVSAKPKASVEQFGSGFTLDFEKGRSESINSELFALWLAGDKAYKEGNSKLAKKYLVEFEAAEVIGENMQERFSSVSKFRQAKYYACEILKNIYYSEKNYKLSFDYYQKALYGYHFGFRCGFDGGIITSDDIYLFDCYEALGNNDKAIKQVLWKMFYSTPIDTNIVVRLYNLLVKNNNKDFLKYEMSYILETIDIKNCSVKFLNTKLNIRISHKDIRRLSDDEKVNFIQETIKNHLFYKLIMEN